MINRQDIDNDLDIEILDVDNMDLSEENLRVLFLIYKNIPGLFNQAHARLNVNEIDIFTSKDKLYDLLTFFKNHTLLRYTSLKDLYSIDLIEYNLNNSNIIINKNERFQLVYCLSSIWYDTKLFIRVNTATMSPMCSVSSLYESSIWLEREIWDLFGLYFNDNPDLRRILTDYGFEGYPLRKDFPLSGCTEISYTTELKKITVKPLELSKKYRLFDFVSPWDLNK